MQRERIRMSSGRLLDDAIDAVVKSADMVRRSQLLAEDADRVLRLVYERTRRAVARSRRTR